MEDGLEVAPKALVAAGPAKRLTTSSLNDEISDFQCLLSYRLRHQDMVRGYSPTVYTFESTTPYAVPRDPTLARYLFSGAPNRATFDIGSGYTLDIQEINVSDDWGGYVDQLLVFDRAGDDRFELELLLADFGADPNPTAFSSTELPLILPDLSVFTHARGFFSTVVSVNYRGHINFDIISMTRQRPPAEVAEPAAITLFGFGLAGLVWLSRRRATAGNRFAPLESRSAAC